jgi:DNA invertase Pin-like site-specific DNA recombinase
VEKEAQNVQQLYGYIRVSTADQNEARQLRALRDTHVPARNVYMDKMSGKNFDRPQYREMVNRLKSGDLLYILSIDRLGRNYEEIQNQWRILTRDMGVDIVVLDMPMLDTRRGKDLVGTFLSDIVLQVLSFVAENERNNIRQRQAEGIAAARERGDPMGRPKMDDPDNFAHIMALWIMHEVTAEQAATRCGMSRSTFYRHARAALKDCMREEEKRLADDGECDDVSEEEEKCAEEYEKAGEDKDNVTYKTSNADGDER